MRVPQYDVEKFVKIWLRAYKEHRSLEWIAEKAGVSRQRVSQRVLYLRSHGVELPSLNKNNKLYAYNKLQQLIDDALAEESNA